MPLGMGLTAKEPQDGLGQGSNRSAHAPAGASPPVRPKLLCALSANPELLCALSANRAPLRALLANGILGNPKKRWPKAHRTDDDWPEALTTQNNTQPGEPVPRDAKVARGTPVPGEDKMSPGTPVPREDNGANTRECAKRTPEQNAAREASAETRECTGRAATKTPSPTTAGHRARSARRPAPQPGKRREAPEGFPADRFERPKGA